MVKKIFLLSLIYFVFPGIQLTAQDNPEMDTLTFKIPSVTVSTTRAKKRETPVTFSEIEEAEIKRKNTVKDLPYLLSELPSIISYSESGNNIGYSNIRLRGFDQRRIAVLVNGIPQNDPEDHNMYWINLSDISSSLESIQVQRGAGMNNYGAPALGGSINLTTTDYIRDRGIKLYSGIGFQQFSGGNKESGQSMSKFSIEASSGLIEEEYAVYGRLSRINSFGYRDQSFAYLNGWFLSATRFGENLTTQVNVFGGSQDDGLVYNGLPKGYIDDPELRTRNYSYWTYAEDGEAVGYAAPRRDQAVEAFRQPHYEILNDWKISESLELKTSLFYYTGKGYFDFDGSWVWDKEQFRLTPEYGFDEDVELPRNSIIRAFVENRHGGFIPRLIWESGPSSLLIGTEVRMHRSDHWGKINYAENLPAGYDPDYKFYHYDGERDVFSIFAREQYKISEKLLISGELQLVHHSYRIDDEKAGPLYTQYFNADGELISGDEDIFDVRYTFLNPRIGANYNFNEQMNIYTSLAFTQREPRMSNLYNASESSFSYATPQFRVADTVGGRVLYDFDDPLVVPEKLFNLELGWGFQGRNYGFGANIYWMEFMDELVKSGQLDIFGAPIDGNAPRTRHYGLELTAAANIANSVSWGRLWADGNLTLSKNEIIEFHYATDAGDLISLEGNSIAGFPDLMGNLRINYQIGELYASILMKHIGEFRTDNFGDQLTGEAIQEDLGSEFYTDNIVDAYTVFNADLAYTFRDLFGARSFRIHAQIFNLTNLLYAQSGEGREFFPAAERTIFIGFELGI
ncbi:MAG: TonB-dependent receptor [Candidatus Kapaibacterium sp.]